MITLEELKKWIEDISNIVIDLNISIKNAQRLTEDKYDFEKQIKKHGFFQHHWYQLKFIMVIQLCKLLGSSQNDKRSFHKLCNILEREKYDLELRNLLSENSKNYKDTFKTRTDIKAEVLVVREKLFKHKDLIDKVVSARNQIYAHIDPNANVGLIKLEVLKELVLLSSELFNHFQSKLFGNKTYLEVLPDWDIGYVLWYMSELRKLDDEERKAKIAGLR
ncbi:MAG: hypothetical protein HY842_07275 [Bacteroidetes bacterium]|nr:hypothetical protein [Bacteroidota bacterium]